jgi:hypothetical protein
MVSSDDLTAFPLNGERLRLKRIDHLLMGLFLHKGFQSIYDPNSDLHKQIGNIYGSSDNPDDLIKVCTAWYDDFSNRLSADRDNAGFSGSVNQDENVELQELSDIVKYARNHIRVDNGKVYKV